MLGARFVTALVGLPVVAIAAWQGGWYWALLLSLASAVATHEYARTVMAGARACVVLAVATSASLPLVAGVGGGDALGRAFVVFVLAGMAAWILHLRADDNAAAERDVGNVLAAVSFPAAGLVALAILRGLPVGLHWVVLVVTATWAADIGAFFVGRARGRHHVCPRISPGKTWEGLVGGGIAAVIASIALRLAGVRGLTWTDHAVVAVVAACIGPLGDLSKSMVKRAHGIKDFGRLLPGHGGVLDRIDALVFNAPCVLVWTLWLRPLLLPS